MTAVLLPITALEEIMTRPKFRIACCLCQRPIALARSIFALDAEWQRRYADMIGTLACGECALRGHKWQCLTSNGAYVEGHIPVRQQDGEPEQQDFDSRSHVLGSGTHVAMVLTHPHSALLQGAEEYLRWAASHRSTPPDVAARLQALQLAYGDHPADTRQKDRQDERPDRSHDGRQ